MGKDNNLELLVEAFEVDDFLNEVKEECGKYWRRGEENAGSIDDLAFASQEVADFQNAMSGLSSLENVTNLVALWRSINEEIKLDNKNIRGIVQSISIINRRDRQTAEEYLKYLRYFIGKDPLPKYKELSELRYKDKFIEYDLNTEIFDFFNERNVFDSTEVDKIDEIVRITAKTARDKPDFIKIIKAVIKAGPYYNNDKNEIRLEVIKYLLEYIEEDEIDTIAELVKIEDFYEKREIYLKAIRDNKKGLPIAIHQLVTFTHPDYELMKVIKSGSNKTTFLARDKKTKREVALKLFDLKRVAEYHREHFGVEGFDFLEHEKRACDISLEGRCENISVVRSVLAYSEKDSIHYIVEELFDRTLEELVEDRKKTEGKALTHRETVFYTAQIVNGLRHLLTRKLSHGDLTPVNVGLKGDVVKLTDMGFTTTIAYDEDSKTFCFRGHTVTPPEQYPKEGDVMSEKPTPQADMWSLGVLMYYMRTGEYPFYTSRAEQKELGLVNYKRKVYGETINVLRNPEVYQRLFEREEFEGEEGGRLKEAIMLCLKERNGDRPETYHPIMYALIGSDLDPIMLSPNYLARRDLMRENDPEGYAQTLEQEEYFMRLKAQEYGAVPDFDELLKKLDPETILLRVADRLETDPDSFWKQVNEIREKRKK